jgi:DNA-binding winged helix-turn-helix (wHTH) protein
MVEFGRFGIWSTPADRLGGRAFDVLTALTEESVVVVGKDELLSRVWQGRIVDQDRELGTIAALR